MTFDRVTFSARRRKAQEEIIAHLEPVVKKGLEEKAKGSETWWRQVVDAARPLFDSIVRDDGGDPDAAIAAWAHLSLDLAHSLAKTKKVEDYSTTLIATWMASNVLSYATEAAAQQAGDPYLLEWVTMHDAKVRHSHKEADGQRVRPGHPFQVGTAHLRRPGDVTAPIKEWINCRCTLAAVPVHENQAASVDTGTRRTGATMTQMIQRPTPTLVGNALVAAVETAPDGSLIPWHGVLTVEGQWSGDRRRFVKGSLSHRDLPLPLTFQKTSAPGHDNNVTVASIDWLEKRGDAWHAGGQVLPTPEADEMVGLLAHFKKFGVSIDADMAEMSFVEYDGTLAPGSDSDEQPGQEFTAGRIAGACVVGIPAFQEAFVTLGEDPDHDYGDTGAAPDLAASIADLMLDGEVEAGEQPGGGYPIANCADLKKAVQAIGRSKDRAKTIAHIKSEKSRLGCPDVELPDNWGMSAEELASAEKFSEALRVEMGRGPGWLTNPADTKRIHDYWTVPGEPGYAKIGWGVDGDFNRCRAEVGSEIGEDSPEKLRFLNQICAQWHKDATGFWPGHAPGETALEHEGTMAPAIALVASAHTVYAPADWFTPLSLTKPTPFTMEEDEDGLIHIFGHVATWDTCHMGFNNPGQCIQVKPSTNNYAYFRTGEVLTTEGPVATGPLTLSTGHAPTSMGMRPAVSHYDNTGTAVADVIAGDDEIGTWVNGWVRPWISQDKVYELRAHPPSGDWRRNPNTGEFDMIAVLSVNAPGLPVVRYGVDNGVQMSIIASLETGQTENSVDVVAEIAAAVVEQMEKRQRVREEIAALSLEEV